MEENKNFKNYSPEEIDAFLSSVIVQVEQMIEESKHKNELIVVQDKRIKECIVQNISEPFEDLDEKLMKVSKSISSSIPFLKSIKKSLDNSLSLKNKLQIFLSSS